MDLSEACGYSVSAQIALCKNLKPLFAGKPTFIIINKIDMMKPEDLDAASKAELDELLKSGDYELLTLSCNTQEGVQAVKTAACERLIAERVAQKLKAGTTSSGGVGGRLADVMQRIHVAMPMGGVVREPYIPEGIKNLKKYDKTDPERRRLARDVEEDEGGAGVYNVSLREQWILKNPDWKYDKIPEVFDGKNVADFIDPDIEAKLAALEEEEERLEEQGYYDSEEEIDASDEEEILGKAELIREKRALIRNDAKMRKRLKNRAIIPRSKLRKPLAEMEDALDQLGVDTEEINLRGREHVQIRARGRSSARTSRKASPDAMDVDQAPRDRLRSLSRARSVPATNRRDDGVQDTAVRTKAERQAKLGQRKMNRMARQGEADRHIGTAMPKHLVRRISHHKGGRWETNRLSSLLGSAAWARPLVVEALSHAHESTCHGSFYSMPLSCARLAMCCASALATDGAGVLGQDRGRKIMREPLRDLPFCACTDDNYIEIPEMNL